MPHPPRSEVFDDVYFSAEDGLAETKHVFLQGNNLPQSWLNRDQFTIAETGFGTGLNFIVAWQLFEETANPLKTLHFISFEKYPLNHDTVAQALYNALPGGQYGDYIEQLLNLSPLPIPGFHKIILSPQCTLTLIFDDVNAALPQLDTPIDCWFLDGFKPATNPDMWSDTVFAHMARLSCPQTTFATFTAAGLVRRGLQSAGFNVQKTPGFGRKRDMLSGVMP